MTPTCCQFVATYHQPRNSSRATNTTASASYRQASRTTQYERTAHGPPQLVSSLASGDADAAPAGHSAIGPYPTEANPSTPAFRRCRALTHRQPRGQADGHAHSPLTHRNHAPQAAHSSTPEFLDRETRAVKHQHDKTRSPAKAAAAHARTAENRPVQELHPIASAMRHRPSPKTSPKSPFVLVGDSPTTRACAAACSDAADDQPIVPDEWTLLTRANVGIAARR